MFLHSDRITKMIYFLSALIGIASWYGSELEGRPTASGEPFDPAALTAASWDFPLGTLLEVTNTATGEQVVVRVNDRGPARRLDRLIDLSRASFERIAHLDQGLIQVKLRNLSDQRETNRPSGDTSPAPESAR